MDLDDLRSLKRRAQELSANHIEALDLFHLDGEPGSLARLRVEPVGVGGFANLVVDGDARHRRTRESLASTARCVRFLQTGGDVKRGKADYTPALERILSPLRKW